MANVLRLVTREEKDNQSVSKCVDAITTLHQEGNLKQIASVYWTKDGRVKLWVSDNMTLADLAYAVKSLDIELNTMMGPGDPVEPKNGA
ncbi:MAG TPA: hypothetical protein VN734_17185 [Acidobacteriaceae bacterium]|nr:hypothetical protein [Acidobacteriaceae bacterium]